MNTKGLITKLRNIISTGTNLALTSVVTPELPQTGDNMIAVTILGGTATDNLCGVQYFDITARALIRGTTNDTTTRELADKVYNCLHLAKNISFDSNNIIQIIAQVPVFVGKDNDLRNLYNITFRIKEK
ncbi:MAG: minor capsid protein [Bacilli bacterium]|nr:minor capsid protein [Bacilli bacterium]